MNEDLQIYVWGSFGIPINGSKKANLPIGSYSYQDSHKLGQTENSTRELFSDT